ncbi:MAG: hypothetical protein R3F11_10320 [Verrucomicrobiales bacterium]
MDRSGKIISACWKDEPRTGDRQNEGRFPLHQVHYHFNPEPNSRALEFDTKNLLKAEGRLKWVRVVDPWCPTRQRSGLDRGAPRRRIC